jgi:hypothetical protein|tara:strand:+ start:780 stop:941 length:162 start_codon:yes stop_codon:yes gene_type:complete
MEIENLKDNVLAAAVAELIDQLNWACEEGESEDQIHELAWQLVNATRPNRGSV